MLSAMMRTITTLERAFQLAEASSCITVTDIKRRLTVEGYTAAQIEGPTLLSQLRALMKARRA